MHEGELALRGELGRPRRGLDQRLAEKDDVRAVRPGLLDLHERGVLGHHDQRRDAEPAGVIRERLAVIARRHRRYAAGALLRRELQQPVQGAALLERGRELPVLELHVDVGAGQP